MTALFADTFYWIALADSNDSARRKAVKHAESILNNRGVRVAHALSSGCPQV